MQEKEVKHSSRNFSEYYILQDWNYVLRLSLARLAEDKRID